MEKFVYYNYLLDIYGFLLTEQNKKIFSLYYSDNLTMQEIADSMQVSKSFVGSSIKKTENKLNTWEENLKILKTKEELKDLLTEHDITKIKTKLTKIVEEK